jgi:hypothetical protein
MRLRRGLVFWGLLLIPLGGIPLLARAGVVPTDLIVDAWRLWPLVLVAFGLLLVVGRTRASLAATAIVAVLIGSIAGAAFAAGPPWVGLAANCGLASSGPTEQTDRSGTFDGAAGVRLDLRCGSLDLRPATNAGWSVSATSRGAAPVVTSSARRLDVVAPTGTQHQAWTILVPAGPVDRLDLTTNAATSTLALDGIQLGSLDATVNAGDVRITVGSGTLEQIHATINAAALRVIAGSTDLRGSMTVNAGGIDLCVPGDANLRLRVTDQLTFGHNLAGSGLTRDGSGVWVRAGSGGTVDLSIEGNAAALTLNPKGGCK